MKLKKMDVEQHAFFGSLQATLQLGKKFEASAIDYRPGFGIFATDDEASNNEPFIYIGFPEGIRAGRYAISPEGQGKVWAYLGIEGKGEATTGELVIEEGQEPGVIAARFAFEGMGEDGQAFVVTQGVFMISPAAVSTPSQRAFAASATITPALSGNTGFDADTLSVRAVDGGRYVIFVTQEEGLEGDLAALGTYFQVGSDGNVNAIAIVDQGLYVTREKTITNFAFEENVRLSFDFSYSFTRNAMDVHVSDGHIVIDWQPN